MTLSEAQRLFCLNIAKLITWTYEQGNELTFGESYNMSRTGHTKNSNHYIRLAQDLNLFKESTYITSSEEYRSLGEHWKALHPLNRWGGDFKHKDGNHFSMLWEGRA